MRALLKFYVWLTDHLDRRFYYYYAKLSGDTHPKNWFDFRHRDFLSRISGSERVVDIGCGTGLLARKVAESHPQAQVLGVDLKARESKLPNLRFLGADFRSEKYRHELAAFQADTVILSHVLEHIEDSRGFLKSLPGKKLLVCVPSRENWRFAAKERLGLDPLTDPTHFREYTPEELRKELTESGYEPSELFYNSEGEIFASARRVD